MSKKNIEMLPIEMVALAEINPASNNSKIHTDAQIESIKASIMEFGYNDPIAIDEKMEIVEGHGRYRAVTELGGTHIPCIRLDQLSPAQVKAYRIAHNKITMQTGFDIDMLKSELHDLDLEGFNVGVTGFSLDDFDFEDFEDLPIGEDGQLESEDAPEKEEVPEKPKSKSVVQYILIFDDEEQQKKWYDFLKYLRENIDGETIAERLDTYLKDQGI